MNLGRDVDLDFEDNSALNIKGAAVEINIYDDLAHRAEAIEDAVVRRKVKEGLRYRERGKATKETLAYLKKHLGTDFD